MAMGQGEDSTQGDSERRICELLGKIPTDGLVAVQQLLCTELGYDHAHEVLSHHLVPDSAPCTLVRSPTILARATSPTGNFDIIYTRLSSSQDSLASPSSLSEERWIIKELLTEHPCALFIFSDRDERRWHFVNVPFDEQVARRQVHRRAELGPDEALETAARCLALIDLSVEAFGHRPLSPLAVQHRHDHAFDPGVAADRFYNGCERIFFDLQADLQGKTADERWPRAYALKLIVRLLFVCLVQRTGWLGHDPQFLSNLWQSYLGSGSRKDSFVRDWLERALFEFLSCTDQTGVAQGNSLPDPVQSLLVSLPRLDGGLFECNERRQQADPAHGLTVTDASFERVLEFLESHALTAREDTALDQQLAVGPAMLGRVYEGLLHTSEEAAQRSESGIYYTAPTEADLMCRLALVDWLANHLGRDQQPLLYQALFASGPCAEQEADAALARRGLWSRIKSLLDTVTVIDPACGSGSFLIAMFQVLDRLLARANCQVGVRESAAERKRRIVAGSLYGIDIKSWAVEIARSRLWLQALGRATVDPAMPALDLKLTSFASRVFCGESLLGSKERDDTSWERTFGEVFAGERCGFDLVVGNPPYVRQEVIDDPHQKPDRVGLKDGARYKARLARAVYAAWPRTFAYDAAQDRALRTLDARSDLYIYFYFQGLSLLHAKGTLCFVTSNSWLDARYGRDLQRFLLAQGQVKLLIDSQASRSFDSADVNTIIILLGAAHDTGTSRPESLQNTLRFVVFHIPFAQAFCPAIWEEVARAAGRRMTPDFRVLPCTQAQLLSAGMGPKQDRYLGDKWGSKYLRAPDIYWRIQEEYPHGFVRLKDVAEVRRGITTGANDFFFLDDKDLARWEIESEYLVPAIKGPRACQSIWLEPRRDTRHYLFMCHAERCELQNTRALAYIEYGEAQGLHERPTCRRRPRWWDLGARTGARVHCNYLIDRVMRFYACERPLLASDSFQAIYSELVPEALIAACNSTLGQLSVNVLGRSNFGGGLLKIQTYEVGDLLIPDPRLLGAEVKEISWGTGLLGLDDPERHTLDEIVAHALGMTRADQEAIHVAVSSMVATRLLKAQSRKQL